jgi:hypothetical protein
MKSVFRACIAVLLLSTSVSFSQQVSTNDTKKPVGLSGPTGGNVLTDDQLAALKKDATDEKTGATYSFAADFGTRSVEPPEQRKYAKSGRIPIRITCSFTETKTVGGKALTRRLSGSSHIYIMDSDGKVVFKKTFPLDKMCPS